MPSSLDDEGAVELGELLDGLAELGPLDVEEFLRMAVKRVEEERTRLREHVVDVSDDEERADLAALAALPCQLHREVDDALESAAPLLVAARAAADRAVGGLEELGLGLRGHALGTNAVRAVVFPRLG